MACKVEYTVSVEDQFKEVGKISKNLQFDYPVEGTATAEKKEDLPSRIIGTGTINMNEVKIVARKQNVFRDKYIGHLDSLAKFEGNTDFVTPNSSWLNVPVGSSGTRPVEGKTYITWNGPNPPHSYPFSFDVTNSKQVVYHYPKFTEEGLLKKVQAYQDQRLL